MSTGCAWTVAGLHITPIPGRDARKQLYVLCPVLGCPLRVPIPSRDSGEFISQESLRYNFYCPLDSFQCAVLA